MHDISEVVPCCFLAVSVAFLLTYFSSCFSDRHHNMWGRNARLVLRLKIKITDHLSAIDENVRYSITGKLRGRQGETPCQVVKCMKVYVWLNNVIPRRFQHVGAVIRQDCHSAAWSVSRCDSTKGCMAWHRRLQLVQSCAE